MKTSLLTALFLAVCTLTSTAIAADSSSGCGLGWEVAQKNSILSSAIRTTTNTILPNTFSMTFGTSGCTKHSIVRNESEQIHFVEANLEQLSLEIAQGDGEYLRTFSAVMGCDLAYGAFSQALQKNYSEIFSERFSPSSVLRGVKNGISSDAQLNRACTTAS